MKNKIERKNDLMQVHHKLALLKQRLNDLSGDIEDIEKLVVNEVLEV